MPYHRTSSRLLSAGATLALVLPTALAYNVPPSATVLNQAAAWLGWGLVVLLMVPAAAQAQAGSSGPLRGLLGVLAVLVAATGVSSVVHALPAALAVSIGGTLVAAGAIAWVFARVDLGRGDGASASDVHVVMRAVCTGFVVAGLLGTAVGVVQVAFPGLADGAWIAHTPFPGRAAGNLRQPNHLAAVLMASTLAAAWHFEQAGRTRPMWASVLLVLVFGLVLTTSRTGAVGVLLMGAWAGVDRSISKPTRRLLWAAPVVFVLLWWIMSTFAGATDAASAGFGGSERLHASDVSSSRFAIWANTFELLRAHPLAGVGVGEFNRAWTLTAFESRRPVAFFDHTHNVVLQLWVELGLPLGLVVTAALVWLLWQSARAPTLHQRFAFMMVLMAVLHSQLEYPLWYAHFLFPTAALLGLCLARRPALHRDAAGPGRTRVAVALQLLAGAALSLGGIGTVADYARVVAIYAPPEDAGPLDPRIAEGRRSLFFAHHGDYAYVTTRPAPELADFERATHYLLDARLMMAWAQAYAAHGDVDRARWIAARLREFHNENARTFFEPCDADPAPPLFACEAPRRRYGPADFR